MRLPWVRGPQLDESEGVDSGETYQFMIKVGAKTLAMIEKSSRQVKAKSVGCRYSL